MSSSLSLQWRQQRPGSEQRDNNCLLKQAAPQPSQQPPAVAPGRDAHPRVAAPRCLKSNRNSPPATLHFRPKHQFCLLLHDPLLALKAGKEVLQTSGLEPVLGHDQNTRENKLKIPAQEESKAGADILRIHFSLDLPDYQSRLDSLWGLQRVPGLWS